MPGPARLDIPLDQPGRFFGAMRLPWSHDRSAYGQIVIPVAILHGGAGPTVLLTGGVHGDEYEGQIVLGALARELDPASVHGRIIIVPTANPAAALAGKRTSPIDGGNLARLFPGDPNGGPTSQIAEGMTRLLLPQVDFLVDFHSGGNTLEYLPCACGRLPTTQSCASASRTSFSHSALRRRPWFAARRRAARSCRRLSRWASSQWLPNLAAAEARHRLRFNCAARTPTRARACRDPPHRRGDFLLDAPSGGGTATTSCAHLGGDCSSRRRPSATK